MTAETKTLGASAFNLTFEKSIFKLKAIMRIKKKKKKRKKERSAIPGFAF